MTVKGVVQKLARAGYLLLEEGNLDQLRFTKVGCGSVIQCHIDLLAPDSRAISTLNVAFMGEGGVAKFKSYCSVSAAIIACELDDRLQNALVV